MTVLGICKIFCTLNCTVQLYWAGFENKSVIKQCDGGEGGGGGGGSILHICAVQQVWCELFCKNI